MKAQAIESDSFQIIDSLVDHSRFGANWPILRRMIHACGDTQIAETFRISEHALEAGITALKEGASIVCDVRMALSGVSKKLKNVYTFIDDPQVAGIAAQSGLTRAETAIAHAAKLYPNAIYLIGNAPTALLALLRLVEAEEMTPALVIGIPVGFVMAKESKDLLVKTKLNYVTNLGYKGGTAMAVAALNAIAPTELGAGRADGAK